MSQNRSSPPYPKPGAVGGKLIREVVQFLKEQGVRLPIDSDILIGVSGGSDSVALAHLLLKYGRRILSPKQVAILHINHGWRGSESDEDEAFVKALGVRFRVPVHVEKGTPPKTGSGKSWED